MGVSLLAWARAARRAYGRGEGERNEGRTGRGSRGVRAQGAPAGYLASRGHEVLDLGARDATPSDYPDHALAAGLAVLDGRAERTILFCGNDVGVAASWGPTAADELLARDGRRWVNPE